MASPAPPAFGSASAAGAPTPRIFSPCGRGFGHVSGLRRGGAGLLRRLAALCVGLRAGASGNWGGCWCFLGVHGEIVLFAADPQRCARALEALDAADGLDGGDSFRQASAVEATMLVALDMSLISPGSFCRAARGAYGSAAATIRPRLRAPARRENRAARADVARVWRPRFSRR